MKSHSLLGLLAFAFPTLLWADSGLDHPMSAAGVTETTAPAQVIPWSALGSKAGEQYQGEALSVTATEAGARLHCGFQKMEGVATGEGLWLSSSTPESHGERFRVTATSLGRGMTSPAPLAASGQVSVAGSLARWERPSLSEEYSVSADGIRQDFIIAAWPEGMGDLRVELSLTGAAAEAAAYGAKLTVDGSHRALAYSRLHVVDATGKQLTARMEVLTEHRLILHVQDAGAAYPIRIDPTFSDANWVSMNSGVPGVNGVVYATAVDNAGNLYVGGFFNVAGNASASNIAMWNGSSWSALGSGLDRGVVTIAVRGATVYVGGQFTVAGGVPACGIAQWNGSTWSAVGAGVTGSVNALVVNGAMLYVGGYFTAAGGVAANNIAQWDGTAWSALGAGVSGGEPGFTPVVSALAVSGTTLYVGGQFTTAGSVPANGIAQWDGSTWSALGSWEYGQVQALAVMGSTLYVGCDAGLMQWDGSTWSATLVSYSEVNALAVSGTTLYVGGFLQLPSGGSVGIAQWNGSTWSGLGSGTTNPDDVRALTVIGNTVYAGGGFASAGGVGVSSVAEWNGNNWVALGSGFNGAVYALAVSGSDIYVGGYFSSAGGVQANGVALWNGSGWSALGTGTGPYSWVSSLAISGSTLYAAGSFIFPTADGTPANYIAQWNGTAWLPLGTGINGQVYALAMNGTTLYAGGNFTTAGGVSANNIAQWNGSTWSPLSTGLTWGTDRLVCQVNALALNGPTLYVGGQFNSAGGVPVSNIAQWDGSVWSTVGSGTTMQVNALAVSGVTLYAGGESGVMQWDGNAWSTLPQSPGYQYVSINALAVSGNTLYVGGEFSSMGGVPANNVAQWNGSAWSAIGSGSNGTVNALAMSGMNLYLGGSFSTVGSTLSPFVAEANFSALTSSFPPIITLGPISSITSGSATLNGTVNPDGYATTMQVEYGLTNSYGSIASVPLSPSDGTTSQFVSATVSGLQTGMLYHYRLSATNTYGTATTADSTFVPLGTYTPTFATAATIPLTSSGFTATGNTLGPVIFNFAPVAGGVYTLVNNTSTGPIDGTFMGLPQGGLVTGSYAGTTYYFNISYTGGDGNDITLTQTLPYTWMNFAGSPTIAGIGNGAGSAAQFYYPGGVAVDAIGNVYVADSSNHTIRKITSGGMVTTLAGSPGNPGSADGVGPNAQFNGPTGVAVDSNGNVYVADCGNCTIRKITSVGVVTTLAGAAGVRNGRNGVGAGAQFNRPTGVAVDGNGIVYVADSGNDAIRKITSGGVVTTLAGEGEFPGSADGTGTAASFNNPTGVAVDSSGNVYVADTYNFTIRKITSAGVVTTLAGTAGMYGSADGTGAAARFGLPEGVAVDTSGNVYVADAEYPTFYSSMALGGTIRMVSSNGAVVTTIGGTAGDMGSAGGAAGAAQFFFPVGVAINAAGLIYVADSYNDRISEGIPGFPPLVTLSAPTYPNSATVVLQGTVNPDGYLTTAQFQYGLTTSYGATASVTLSPGNSSTAQSVSTTLTGLPSGVLYHYSLTATNQYGTQTTSDGTFVTGGNLSPTFATPSTTYLTANGFTATGITLGPVTLNFTPASGGVYTLVSNTSPGPVNGIFTGLPEGSLVSTIYGGATYYFLLSYIGGDGNDITLTQTIPYNWTKFYGGMSSINVSYGVAVDLSGNVYASTFQHTILKITSGGSVTTLAGTAGVYGYSDGTGSAAQFSFPEGLAVDANGNVYVADNGNNALRKITSGGVVTTFAGTPGGTNLDGPRAVAPDGSGNVYFTNMAPFGLQMVTSAGVVSTPNLSFPNSSTGLNEFMHPMGLAVDGGGNVYVANTYQCTICAFGASRVVTTLAGNGTSGSSNGVGSAARFYYPQGVAVDNGGNIYVADSDNCSIRMINSAGVVTTIGGTSGVSGNALGLGPSALFYYPVAIAVSSTGLVYVVDAGNNQIYVGTPVPPIASSPMTPMAQWRVQNFNVSTNSGMAANTATPDGDGIPNLLKYGLVIPMGIPGANSLPAAHPQSYEDGNHLAITLTRDPTRTDVTLNVQAASSPAGPWTTLATSTGGAPFTGQGLINETTTSGGLISVQVGDVVTTVSAPSRFMRVTVTN